MFVTTGGKEQATGIVREKANELMKLVPGLANEVNLDRGASKNTKEEFTFVFKNGSLLDVMAARQSSRGKRATGGLIEEVSNIALIYLFRFISGVNTKLCIS